MILSHFLSLSEPHAKELSFSFWRDVIRWFRIPRQHVAKGSDGEGWSPARFSSLHSIPLDPSWKLQKQKHWALCNSPHRALETVQSVEALVWDYDRGSTIEEIDDWWSGVAWWAHESRSSTTEHPKWRVVTFLSRTVTGPEYSDLWLALSKRAGGVYPNGALDGATKDPSRFWFLPCELADGSKPSCVFCQGSLIDVDSELERYLAAVTPERRVATWDPGQPMGESRRALVALQRCCETIASTGSGMRHETIRSSALKLGHLLCSGELDETLAIDSLLDAATACGYVKEYGEACAMRVIEFGLSNGRKTMPSVPLRKR
jgi:hypothetical protein